MVHILGIGGSRRDGSATLLALRAALDGARSAGAETSLLDLTALDLPLFDGTYDLASYSAVQQESILRLFDAVSRSQGIILASPTYHSTISGALKNLLDFLDIGEVGVEAPGRRFASKAVGLITVQGGTSGTGNNTLLTMLLASRSMGGWVVPTVVSVPGGRGAFDAQGTAQDPAIQQRLHSLGAEVTAASTMLAEHWTVSA
jgi:FMN reductase